MGPHEHGAEAREALAVAEAAAAVHVGGPLARHPLTFSADDKLLLCPSGEAVKLYAVATGERVGELRGHTAEVTCVARNPADALQVLTAALDGTVRCWDLETRRCLQSWSAGSPVLHMCVVPQGGAAGQQEVYLNVNPKVLAGEGRGACRVVRLELATSRVTVLYKARSCTALAVSPRGDYVVSLSNRTLSCWSVRRQELVKHRHARALTTVAFHPTDPFLATGDDKGQIVLWHNFVHADTAKVVNSTLHWHAHAVTALAFTDDGAYMMSGGEEAVLVLWQLQSEHRQFLPRLGAAIHGIEVSPSGRRYALRCADNAIRIVDAITSRAERVIRGLQAHSTARSGTAGAAAGPLLSRPAVEPRAELLVLPAGPGSVQFYDVHGDRHVSGLEVIPRNFVSRVENERLSPTRVGRVAFSRDGAWMATSESRPQAPEAGGRGSALKLWRFDRSRQQYVLNTRVNEPHDGEVTALAFHPSGALLLTASADSRFKLWRAAELEPEATLAQNLRAAGKRKKKKKSKRGKEEDAAAAAAAAAAAQETRYTWRCQSVGTYRPYGVSDAAFSHDGSLMAVTYGQLVTLWDPATLELRHTLVYPGPEEPVRRVFFCRGSPFLVAATARAVYVWNLLTLSLWWSYSLPVAAVASDPHSSRFAVAVRRDLRRAAPREGEGEGAADGGEGAADGDDEDDGLDRAVPVPYVLEFDPSSPAPARAIAASDLLVGRGESPLVYVPRRGGRADEPSSLLYVAADRSLVRLDRADVEAGGDDEAGTEAGDAAGAAAAAAAKSYDSVFGGGAAGAAAAAAAAAKSGVAAAGAPSRVAAADELFAGPAHAASSLDAAFDSLVRSVVTEKATAASLGGAEAADGAADARAPRKSKKERRAERELQQQVQQLEEQRQRQRAALKAAAETVPVLGEERSAGVVAAAEAGSGGNGGLVREMLKRRRDAAAAWSDSDDDDDDESDSSDGAAAKRRKKAAAADKKKKTKAKKAKGTPRKGKKAAAAASPAGPTPRRTRRSHE